MHVLGRTPLLAALAACQLPPPRPVPETGVPAACALTPADSTWLEAAMAQWTRVGERALRLRPAPVPPILLFDDRCTYHVNPGGTWQVTAARHAGSVELPNGRAMPVRGVAITSPAPGDTGIFLAIALPDAWRSDPRYGLSDSRAEWERYLIGAFAHEMAHARMLEHMLPRLRAIEAAVYPDTVEDNAVQKRFAADRGFAQSVNAEIGLLHRAVLSPSASTRSQYVREALRMMRERWDRYYIGDLRGWRDLELAFLDLEGVGQWVAFHVRWGSVVGPSRAQGSVFDRLLARFRAHREFWSEDQGLLLVLALDAMVPGWQERIFAPNAPSAYELLERAVARER